MKNNRIVIFDYLRGLSILMIVLYHFALWFPINSQNLNVPFFLSKIFVFNNLILNLVFAILRLGWQFVGVFIFLSGFGLAYSYLSKKENKIFLVKRIKKIIPAWQFAILFSFIINFILVRFFKSDLIKIPSLDIKDYFLLFIFPAFIDLKFVYIDKINDTLWFIVLILQFYVFFEFLISKIKLLGNKKFLFWTLFITISFRFLSILILNQGILPLSFVDSILGVVLKTFPSRLFEFSLGMITAKLYLENNNVIKNINIKEFLFGILLWFLGTISTYNIWGWIISDLLITVGLLLITIFLLKRLENLFISKYLVFLSEFSFFIYLFHGRLIQLFNILVLKSFVLIQNYNFLFLFSFFIILYAFQFLSLFFKNQEK